jgi:hypothetical protein
VAQSSEGLLAQQPPEQRQFSDLELFFYERPGLQPDDG